MPDVVVSNEHATPGVLPAKSVHGAETPYFAVSLTKLAVMSICTMGIYELYWFYRNWRLIKDREGLDIRPFWRVFFAYFYCYQCFDHIRAHALRLGLPTSMEMGPLAAAWIIITILWKLPDPYWLVTMLGFLPMLPVQSLANRINTEENPEHHRNSRFTGWNIAMVIIGGLLLILTVIGTFLPEE